MAKIPFWQSIQNNRLLQPFQVRDVSGRTLFSRARWQLLFVLLALILLFVTSNRQINLLVNRDRLEQTESSFVSQFYPAYDSLYYWMVYQGNLARGVATILDDETGSERFLESLTTSLQQLNGLRLVQFGQVGVNSQWVATPGEDGAWTLSSEVNQDFAAWLLTQELAPDQIYWYNARPGSGEIDLFWFYLGENGEKVYFLAAVGFDYRLEGEVWPSDQAGAVIFLSTTGRQLYPLQLGQSDRSASTPAQLSEEPGEREWLAWEGLATEELVRLAAESARTLLPLQLAGENFWVKIVPVVTHTDYTRLAIIMPESEPLESLGIRSTWLQWALLVFIAFNFALFFFYYWRYSRRYYFTNQIKDLIKNGESGQLEFKSTLRFDLKDQSLNKNLEGAILKSIAAFNNTDGGLLIIGVSDEARVLGLENDYATLKKPDKDGFELHLRALISQAYGQHFAARRVEIFFPVIENKEVCVVNVKKGRSALYTDITDKNGNKLEKFYIRMGNSSREIEKLSDIVDYQNQRFKMHLPKLGKK